MRKFALKLHKFATSRSKTHRIATSRGSPTTPGPEAAGLCGPFTRGGNLVRFLARGGRFVRNLGPKPHETATSRVKTHRIATWRGLPPISGTCGLQLCGGCPTGWLRPRVRWGFKLLHRWLTGAESGNRHVTRVGPNLDSAKGCMDRQSAGCTSPGSQVRGLLARAMQGRNVHLVSGGALCTAD